GVYEHPWHHAVRPVAEPGERDAERNEHDQRLEESVGESEGDADEDDRRPLPEEAEQRLAGTAKGQLLDKRRDRHEEDEVGGEGASVCRLPRNVRDPLLLAGAL